MKKLEFVKHYRTQNRSAAKNLKKKKIHRKNSMEKIYMMIFSILVHMPPVNESSDDEQNEPYIVE